MALDEWLSDSSVGSTVSVTSAFTNFTIASFQCRGYGCVCIRSAHCARSHVWRLSWRRHFWLKIVTQRQAACSALPVWYLPMDSGWWPSSLSPASLHSQDQYLIAQIAVWREEP